MKAFDFWIDGLLLIEYWRDANATSGGDFDGFVVGFLQEDF
jgi:hypothetical protein